MIRWSSMCISGCGAPVWREGSVDIYLMNCVYRHTTLFFGNGILQFWMQENSPSCENFLLWRPFTVWSLIDGSRAVPEHTTTEALILHELHYLFVVLLQCHLLNCFSLPRSSTVCTYANLWVKGEPLKFRFKSFLAIAGITGTAHKKDLEFV